MKKIKIIQISSASPSSFLNSGKGDINTILKDDWFAQVARGLKKDYPELEIECWAPEKEYKKEKQDICFGIKFRVFPTTISIRPGMEISFKMIKALKQEIKKAEKKNKKLIIHFHEHHSWQVYLLLSVIRKMENMKIISQNHGGRSPFKNLKKYKRLILLLPVIILMQIFESLFFRKVDLFYSLSDGETAYLRKITNSEIKFQTMGIGEEYFNKTDKDKVRKKLGLDSKKKYVLYVGRIKTTKGIKELLDAMKLIDGNVELLLIGNGPDFDTYKKYAEINKINNVNFLGAVYSSKKLDYLSAADCFILPSYTEGAPVVLMEAIARNLPVVASDVGGVRKMIENGREGIIIKPKSVSAIVRALNEVLNWKRKNIRKHAEKYKWNKIIKQTYEDYVNWCNYSCL